MFAKDFSKRTICPFDREGGTGKCDREDCPMWHPATDPQYSCCGFYLLVHDLNTIAYTLKCERY